MGIPVFRAAYAEGEEGFTLAELLTVVAIVGILAIAFGASFVSWRERYNAESDIKSLHGALVDARVNAIREKRVFFVDIPKPVAKEDPHILKIYRDVNTKLDPADWDKFPGDGNLEREPGKDPQHGPDLVFKNRLHLEDDFRTFWFTGNGYLQYDEMPVLGRRDFQIRMVQWESNVSAQADFNCLRISPPLYLAGGLWNATEDQEENNPTQYNNIALEYSESSKTLVTPGLTFPLCTMK